MRVTKKYLRGDAAIICVERFHAYQNKFTIFDCYLTTRQKDGVRGPLYRLDRDYWGYQSSPSWQCDYHLQIYTISSPWTHEHPFTIITNNGLYYTINKLRDLPYAFIDLALFIGQISQEDLKRKIITIKANPLSASMYILDCRGNVIIYEPEAFNMHQVTP